MPASANFGIDAPGVIRNFVLLALAALLMFPPTWRVSARKPDAAPVS